MAARLYEELMEELLEEAAAAEDVAAAFYPFLSRIYEYSAEISAVISELFGISSAFRDLAKTLESPRLSSYSRVDLYLDDIELSLDKVFFTLNCVEYHFERLGITPDPHTPAYGRVWREIQSSLRDGSITFLEKLRMFKDFLFGLVDHLRGGRPDYDMRLLREQIVSLRTRMGHDMLLNDFGNLSFGGALGFAGVPEPRQPEPRLQPRRPRRGSAGRPSRRYSFFDDDHRYPPESPDPPPISPVTTTSSSSSESRQHWAHAIFDGRYRITPFSTQGLTSRCLGKHQEDAEYHLLRNHQRLLELELEDGGFVVQLYWNPSANRAMILCMSGHSWDKSQSYFPLSQLGVSRQETCLQLYHLSQSRSSTRPLWARLRFRCYERMVLFFCTIVALRVQGPPDVPMTPNDYRLDGEKMLGEFKIHDDDFLHSLRIFKDRDSGGVRLEAAVYSGELKDTPVWTAFITERIGDRTGIRRTNQRIIQFPGLHPYVFSPDYSVSQPQQQQRSQAPFELHFAKSEDASGFMEALRPLRPRQ
ncbi:MAG: hypothetical protein M1816_003575 [Peltula sp. TS41687]|nr:MAG: hypothetical protein M1816_003575 [Peltula sp. TS41687]